MNCQFLKINPNKPQSYIIQKAAQIIKRGGLVAFPTETVYGLGANALDKRAVKKIFKAKKRPSDNPLIVHIAEVGDLNLLVKNIPPKAKILITKFWPGPLTLVFLKKKVVPDEVTAGVNTVAVRLPKNKIILELIKKAGLPIAAPSANLAGRPSPTDAKHVFNDLGRSRKVALILDGGRTKIGLESTVVDFTTSPPLILRPGGLSFEKIRKLVGEIQFHSSLQGKKLKGKAKSPGMKYRHYAPKAPLVLIGGGLKERAKKIKNLINFYQKEKKIIGAMASLETKHLYRGADLVLTVGSRKNLQKIANNLFHCLRQFDKKKIDIILAETYPEKGIGCAIMHRLKRAAEQGFDDS